MSTELIGKAIAAHEEQERIIAQATARRNAERAVWIARKIDEWFGERPDPMPTTLPFVYGGLLWNVRGYDSEREVFIRWPERDFYDEEGNEVKPYVHDAASVGAAIAEDRGFCDYLREIKPIGEGEEENENAAG